jgi:hypothetical protein
VRHSYAVRPRKTEGGAEYPMSLPATKSRRGSTPSDTRALMMERHFTLRQIAEAWGFSYDFVRERFVDEPGVLYAGNGAGKGKRTYGHMRVPESVVQRVYARMVVA